MPGDAIAITIMDMGTCQVPQVGPMLVFNGGISGRIQGHHACFARGHISGHQREVLICSSLQEPRLELICILCRFMTVCLMWGDSVLPLFVGCLESLPNLHTLEIGQVHGFIDAPLRKALSGVNLPQIKTLVLPPATYPLLNHCSDVEDVVCVIGYRTILSEEFLESLASNPDSKVKRLAIPLVSRSNSSRE